MASFSLLLIHFLRLLLLCQSVHSVVVHPRLRALNAAAISSEQLQQRPHHRHHHQRHIKTATATATAAEEEEEQEQTNNISRGRWYGEEAKQMLRQLDELRLRKAIQQQQKAVKLPKLSLFDKFISLFTEKPDDEGSKHDCFFSAFNCPVNPARSIPGVRRVRITAEERNKLLANRRHGTGFEGHGTGFEGHGTVFEGHGTVFEGHGTVFEGHGTDSEGHGTDFEGHGTNQTFPPPPPVCSFVVAVVF
uniref:Uncharacterized protein n=1 Tax=Globodera rostochiensis TaxID=31243 RepID=A0A914I480_GLORO